MKRLFTLLSIAAAAMVATTSCQQEDPMGQQSGEVEIAIKATLPQSIGTYAAAIPNSGTGGIDNVDPASYDLRYIMEVWTKEATPHRAYRAVQSIDDWSADKAVTFNVRLLAKEYDFVFWADFVNEDADISDQAATADLHYTTTSLDNIQMKGTYAIGDDARDAYYGKQVVNLTTSGATIGGIELKRPFGKVRLVATDKPENTDGTIAPTSVTLNYGANTFYNAFNALNGAVVGSKVTPATPLTYTPVLENDNYVLGFDYIFAADDLTSMDGVSVAITVNGETYNKTLPTVPVAANKLTTVKGNFYSNESTLTVEVSDAFAATEETPVPNVVVVQSISAVNDILTNGAVNASGYPISITVQNAVSNDASIDIPTSVTAGTTPTIELDLSAGIESGKTITIGDANNDTSFAGTINVIVPATSEGSLQIKAPQAHVVVNGKYASVTASTSATTLVIEKDCSIANLTINSGNVVIMGPVASLTKADGYTGQVSVHVGNTADFEKVFASSKIDVIILDACTINESGTGQLGLTDRPLTIKGVSADKTILNYAFDASQNLTLENLTLNTAENPILDMTSTAKLIATNCVFNQNKQGTADGLATAPAAVTTQSAQVELYGCQVYLHSTKYVRGINVKMDAVTAGHVILDNTSIVTDCAIGGNPQNATYARGINVYADTKIEGKLTVDVLNGSKLAGFYYPFNITGNTSGVVANITNSVVDGFCSINLWSNNNIFTISGSSLTGRNNYSGSSDGFSTIVVNREVESNQFLITDSEIRNIQTGAASQSLFSLRGEKNTVSIKGDSKLIDSTKGLNYFISQMGYANNLAGVGGSYDTRGKNYISAEQSVVFDGKEGVALDEQP